MPMLTQLAAIARKTGYPVIEVPGWKTRGHGPMGTIRTITCHHTAGPVTGDYPSLPVVRDGRKDLPGPLAQLGVGRAGTIYVIAAGLSYHAGASLNPNWTNSHAIGIEAEATGIPGAKADWPGDQYAAFARLCAALVDHFGLTVADVRGHKETAAPKGRKVDPSFDMATFRIRVSAANLKTPPKSEPPKTAPAKAVEQENDMQWGDEIKLTATDADIWTKHSGETYTAGQKVGVGVMLRFPTLARRIEIRQNAIASELAAVKAQNAALAKQVTTLTTQVTTQSSQLAQILAALKAQG